MTVLYSCYVPEGIIFVADTMLTVQKGRRTLFFDSTEPKVFRVPGLGDHRQGGLLGYFGNGMVKRRTMAGWLREAIAEYPPSADTSTFSTFLVKRLERAAYTTQLRSIQGFHVGAFERRGGYRLPVFWFIRNAQIEDGVAGYQPFPGWEFRCDEQLLGEAYRALQKAEILPTIRRHVRTHGVPLWFRNGDLYAFAPAGGAIDQAARVMISDLAPDYRVPRSLNRWTQLAKTYVTLSADLVQIYYGGGTPKIGGDVVAERIPWEDRP